MIPEVRRPGCLFWLRQATFPLGAYFFMGKMGGVPLWISKGAENHQGLMQRNRGRPRWCGLWPVVSVVLWMWWTNSHGLQKSGGEKGQHGHSLSERVPQPLPGQAFIAFLGALHQGRSSFIMHRKGCCYLLLTDNKEKDVANARGKAVELVTLHPWNGLAQTLGSYFKDMH